MMKNLLITIILLSTSFLYAQSSVDGTVTGTIKDSNTNLPLPGANIIIVGTILGASSDLDGNFTIHKIPAGTFQVKATMMGYSSATLIVVVEPGITKQISFNLNETVIETPTVVVTAGKKAQSFQDVPNSVSLISAREIERKNLTFLDEVLEYTPGVTVVEGDVNIRGSSGYSMGAGSRVLLLVDGIPMMPGDSGDIKWDIIPLSQIERVEIVKGAGSALYGSHALGGVINIISKEPSSKPLTEIKFSTGLYDEPYYPEWKWTDRTLHFNQTDLTFTRKLKNVGLLISGGRRESTGYQQNGHYLKLNLLGRLDIKFDPQKQLLIQSSWSNDDRGEIFMWKNQNDVYEMPITSVGDEIVSEKYSLNTVYRHLINQKFVYKIRTSYFRNTWQHYYHDSDAFSKAQKLGLEIQGDYLLNKMQSFTLGIEGIYDKTNSQMFGNHDASTWAAFIQDELHLTDLITATLGFRYDYHSVDTGLEDNQFNPKLGFTFKPSPITTIRCAFGRGFRSPTMAEMFTQTATSGFKVIPNPNLKAEKAYSYELGLNQILSENILIDIAAFYNDYWNFIEPEPDIQNTVQFINVNRARIKGVEIMAQSSWWKKRITNVLSYTYLQPKDIVTNETLAYRPKHFFSCSINYNYKIFQSGIDFRYVSKLENVKVYPDDDRVDQRVFDFQIGINLTKYSISGNINNLFNYSYNQIERNMAPVRNYVITFTGKL